MQARGLEMMRKLALIVSFCLGTVSGPASALGLGEIELRSALNEPLRAEIPLFAVRPGQRDLITVRIADTEAFTRAGIARTSILSDIRFAVAPGEAADQAVLQLKTATPVREPFLSMLLEVTWPEGRLIREYTALVDPPGTVRAPPSTRSRPADSGGFTTRPYAPAGEAPARTTADAGAHEYGPVRADETLWSIAYAQRPSDSITMDQMMLAIYEANPDAFDGSVNRIRAGSMLRIPSAESVRAIDPSQARREVGQQRRRARAPSAPAREEIAEAPPAVAPPPAEAEPAPPPKPKGELRLSPPEGAAPTPAAPQGDTLPAPPPPPIVEEAPAVPPPATGEAAPPATVEAPAPAPARGTTPIEIRDNSAKALELLAAHAREQSARQASGEPLATETAPQPAAPAAEAPVIPAPTPPPAVTPAPAETAPAAPPAETAPAAPPATAESPFADQPTPATPSSPATPAPPSVPAEQAPPAAAPPQAATPPAPASAADSGAVLGALNPLMLGLAAAAVLLIGLAAVKLRQRRRRPAVTLAPIVLSEVEPGANTFGQTLEAPKPAGRVADTLQATIPPAARTIETTMQSTMPPERTTQQFMAVSTPQAAAAPAPPPPADSAAPGGVDPYADALSEVDIHIAYGLYDEAARLLQEPLAKSPERKDLHLKLLEVYFSANLPNEFEAQAKTMRSIVGNDTDPDWQKACIMGQQLCPASPLFATAGAASGAAIGATADMDFSSLLSPAQAQTPPPAATPASPPSLDFAGLDLGLDKAATVKPPPKPAAPPPAPPPAPAPAAPAPEANTLDFNLDDFKLDVPASVSAPPEKAAPADEGLDIDLSDFDVGAPAAAPSAAPAAAATGGEIDMDDLLTADAVEGAAEQADTRLDLARAYMDMGEPAMAQSLLQEVIAQGTTGQKQEAQELLNRLNAG